MAYEHTIQTIRTALTDVFDRLDTWFDTPQTARRYQPADGGWTIDEMLEHITLVNHFLMLVIGKRCERASKRAQRQPLPMIGESDLERLESIGDPTAFIWLPPEHMKPTREPTNTEVRDLMRKQQQQCLAYLQMLGHGEGAFHTVRMSVQGLGKIDMYQWLYFLVLHAQRHLRQIEAIFREWQPG